MTDDFRIAVAAARRILTKLQQISDAPTGHLRTGPKPPHYAEARIPEGVRTRQDLTTSNGNGQGGHAPSKQFSLWGHYHYRMERAFAAQDASTLLKLAACATRDYELYLGKRTTQHASHETAVIELLRDCQGMSAIEASWWLDAPLKWVRRHRVLNGRDAEFGEPTRQDERTRKVLALAASGLKQRMIAEELGITQQRVSQILAGA